MNIRIRPAWDKNDPALIRDAKAFWLENKMLTPAQAEDRAKELVAVAYDGEKVLGVSTATATSFHMLRSRFLYYRTALAKESAAIEVAEQLVSRSKTILSEWTGAHPEEKIKGLLIVFEAREFASAYHEPINRRLDFELVLVGYNQAGHQIRVLWFDDAWLE